MPVSAPSSLKEYLKKYQSADEQEKKKKKKKKEQKTKPETSRVLVVDEDPVWQKPVNIEEESENSAEEDTPQVDEDIEVKRMKRLEQLRELRKNNPISEDGSGWVSLSPKHAKLSSQNADIYSSSRKRTRNDTPSPEAEPKPTDSDKQDADFSPPRQRRTHHQTLSPERDTDPAHLHGRISDLSPPRKRRERNDTPSPGPEVKPSISERVDGDLSPPRLRQRGNRAGSPVIVRGPLLSEGQNSDISPPRRRRVQNDTPSPEPKERRMYDARVDSDLSPPRQHRKRHDSPSEGYTRKKFEPSDLSPPRRQRVRNDTPSPEPREKPIYDARKDPHLSPPRQQRKRHDSPDMSPPRRSQDNSHASPTSDLSPPRKGRKDSERHQSPEISHKRPNRRSIEDDTKREDLSPPRRKREEPSLKTSLREQSRTGLISGRDIREEIAKTKKDELLRIQEMESSISGRGAEPVYRDKKTGERISKEEFLKLQKKVEEKPKEIKIEWGKGLAQKRAAEARLQEIELEKEKPFARTRDDPDLDSMLKDRVRWGDPMAHLVKKKHSEPVLPNLGDNEKMKESGFIVPQDVPSHSWLKRGLDAAPNRFGIRPGRHWDGVDRSNGFEKGLFKRMNEKQATQREAYLWSVSDM